MAHKQAIVLDKDIEISEGKAIAQACHASIGAFRKTSDKVRKNWKSSGEKKVVLESGKESLKDLFNQANQNNLPAYLVKDAGRTEIPSGTVTALGVGPGKESKIDEITGQLRLLE